MTFNRTVFKIASALTCAFLLTFVTSCSTDDDGNDGKGDEFPEVFLVAQADLDFTDEEPWQLNCYRQPSYGELIIHGDTLFMLRLSDTDIHGSAIMTASMLISVRSQTGFEAGTIYQFTEVQDDDQSSIIFTRHKENGADLYMLNSGTDDEGEFSDTGSLTITSISNNFVEGTFEFTVHHLIDPFKKVEVRNGVFHGDLYRY